jgi:hypothetical protein
MSTPHDPAAAWARLEIAKRVLAKVSSAFVDAGIDVLAVKGVVTAGWLYPRAGDRPLTDIDLRIRPRDLDAATACAEKQRWEVVRHIRSYRNLVLRVDGLAVDVECHIGPRAWSAVSVDEVLQRATRDAQGFSIPDAHDHALLLTLNVFKDKLTQAMPWAVEDVARVVDAPGFDLGTYVDRVRQARVSGPAWIVADWMSDRHNHATWRRIRGLLGGDLPARGRYARLMRRRLVEGGAFALPVRILVRAASDDARRWLPAIGLSLAWELESRWERRRRSR